MYCRTCGTQIPDTSAFCPQCGTSQETSSPPTGIAAPAPPFVPAAPQAFAAPAPAVKQARKKNITAIVFAAISVLLAAALVLSFLGILPSPSGSAAASTAGLASQSFATPEEAIESFVTYLKAGDYNGALSTCAIDNMAAGFDYQKYAERLLALTPLGISCMPSEYPQYIKYNAYKNALTVLNQMIAFTISFNLSEKDSGIINGMTTPLENGQFPDDLLKELNPSTLGSLEIIKIAKTGLHDTDINRENQKKQAAIYGADDVQFRSVLYKYNSSYYVGGFTLIEYNGKWQIQNMTDPIMGIPAFGTPLPVSSEDEFEGMLG